MTILLEAASCLQGWTLNENSCYRLFSTKKNWDDAETDCENEDGHLVSISSNIENSFVYSLAKNANKDVWIGLNDKTVENSFVWSDGTTCLYRQWDDNQPNGGNSEDCTKMKKGNGQWVDKKCSDKGTKYYYVCETPTLTTHSPLLTTGVTFRHLTLLKYYFKMLLFSSVIHAMPVMLDS